MEIGARPTREHDGMHARATRTEDSRRGLPLSTLPLSTDDAPACSAHGPTLTVDDLLGDGTDLIDLVTAAARETLERLRTDTQVTGGPITA